MQRIFIEAEKCDGCKNCSIACMQAHRTDKPDKLDKIDKSGGVYDLDLTDLKNESRNLIILNAENKYIPIFCRHCDNPECVMSCMSGALSKDPVTGHIRYDIKKCGACFMCVMNCPYGVPKPDHITHTSVIKCDFCVNDGENPNCVKSCPTKAIYIKNVDVKEA